MTIYIYVKTHNKTGLKYLGKTEKDPYKYKGSGKEWLPHIKKYGNDVTTVILKECSTTEELSYWGRYYSNIWCVVTAQDDYGNKLWANKIPETGGGGININHLANFNKGKNNPMYGKKRPDLAAPTSPNKTLERRLENSEKSKLMWQRLGYRESAASFRKSLWQDADYLEKMKNRPTSVKQVSIDGKIYQSLQEAATVLGIHPSTVSKRCSSTLDRFKDWVYVTVVQE
jgi:hypothetical protein